MTIKSSKDPRIRTTPFNPKRWLKPFCLLLVGLVVGTFKLCWNCLVFLIDLIDGGDEAPRESSTKNTVWYNPPVA